MLVPIVRAWATAVEAKALGRLVAGHKLPGYKLVPGKRTRKWKSDKTALRFLLKRGLQEDEVCPRVLISPAEAERLLGKKKSVELVNLVEWTSGRPTIAPESDSRQAIDLDPFADVEV